MAAVLACGEGAFLTHLSAGAHYGICEERPARIEVSVPRTHLVGPPHIRVRRRPSVANQDIGTLQRIPITSPVRTMLDLATVFGPKSLARAVNEADKLVVVDAEALLTELDAYAGHAGVRPLRTLLDRDTFVLTEEELERLFLPLAREAGLPLPKTKEIVNGYEVDFFWPELKLVVEADGLRYHRTPSAQAKDARRDQTHTAAGFARLRFSHHQVKYERAYVGRILGETASRLTLRG
jgi:very-short-patch-repair endonuclease